MGNAYLAAQRSGKLKYVVSTVNSGTTSNPAVTISGLSFQPKGVAVLASNYVSVSSGSPDTDNFGRLASVHLKDVGAIYRFNASISMDVTYAASSITIKWTYPNPGKAYMYCVNATYVVIG